MRYKRVVSILTSVYFRYRLSRFIDAGTILLLLIVVGIDHYFWLTPLVLTIPLLVVVEVTLLSLFGTTLGMLFLGIEVLSRESGKKLSPMQALKRSIFPGKKLIEVRSAHFSLGRKLGVAVCVTLSAYMAFGATDYYSMSGNPFSDGNWVEYVSEKGKFSIAFPETPEKESKKYGKSASNSGIRLEHYAAIGDGEMRYSVAHVDIPSMWKLAGVKRILHESLQLMLHEIGDPKLLFHTFSKLHHHRTLNFSYEVEKELVEGKLLLRGNRLFLLTVQGKGLKKNISDAHAFFDSFSAHA